MSRVKSNWRALLLVLLLATVQCSKEPCSHAQIQLAELASTQVFGGDCERILISKGQRHALTVGDYGDLVWWDIATRRPLRHVPGATRYAGAVALHPSRPLVAVSWSDGSWGGSVHALDMGNGQHTNWLNHPATLLRFGATRLALRQGRETRQRLATHLIDDLLRGNTAPLWERDWHAYGSSIGHLLLFEDDGSLTTTTASKRYLQQDSAESANREVTAVRLRKPKTFYSSIVEVGDKAHFFDRAHIERVAVTNNRVLLASDSRGHVFVQGPTDSDRHLHAPHHGHADRMVFCPDGSHLAIMSIGAVRIVDLMGTVKLTLEDTHIVSAGADGANFWVTSRTGSRRWNAASQAYVGEPLRWRADNVELIRDSTSPPTWRPENRPWRLDRLSIAEVGLGDAWLIGDEFGPYMMRQRGDVLTRVASTDATPIALQLLPRSSHRLFLSGTQNMVRMNWVASLQRLDATGLVLHEWSSITAPRWLAVNDAGTHAWIGTSSGLVGVSCDKLEETVLHANGAKFRYGLAWHDNSLLVVANGDLQVVDAMTLRVKQQLPRPEGLSNVDLIAASPDRAHVAIASHTAVHIFRLH